MSLVSASGNGAYMSYIDPSSDAEFKARSGTTNASWGSSSTIQAGTVDSLSTSHLADSGDFVTIFVDNGEVRYSQASSPYTEWSAQLLYLLKPLGFGAQCAASRLIGSASLPDKGTI